MRRQQQQRAKADAPRSSSALSTSATAAVVGEPGSTSVRALLQRGRLTAAATAAFKRLGLSLNAGEANGIKWRVVKKPHSFSKKRYGPVKIQH